MPDAGIDPIQLGLLSGDPTAALQAQRKLALAQALQGMALGGPQQPQQLGLEGTRYPHAARVGPAAAIAPLLEAIMANKGYKTALPAMANVYGQAAGAFQPQQVPGTPLQAAPQGDSNSQDVQPLIQRLPGASLGQTVQATQPHMANSPLNPLGLPPNLALQAWLKDPAKYADLIAGTPEWRTALAASGGNPQMAMRMLQSEAIKKGTIEARPGSTSLIPQPGGGYQNFIAPDVSRGEQYTNTPEGTVASPIAGSSDIQAGRAGAHKAAEVAAEPKWIEDPFHPGQGHWEAPYRAPSTAPSIPRPPPSASAIPPTGFFPKGGGTAADLEQQKKGAESGQVYSDQLDKNAENATELRASLAELKNLAKAGGVSASNPAKQELGSYLVAAGMDPQTVGNMLHTDISALIAAQKQTGNLAINSIHKFTSRGSNFDLATFMRYNPNLDMGSQQGFQRVVDFMDKRLQQDVAKQADFQHFISSSNIPPNRWASAHTTHWLGLQNKLIGMGATNSGAAPVDSDVQAEIARRGLQ